MADQKTILDRMIQLSDAAKAAPLSDPITLAEINKVADPTQNQIQIADGILGISFGAAVEEGAYTIAYNPTTTVMTLHNLTTGEIDSVIAGDTPIPELSIQFLTFATLGAVIVLNGAFDKSLPIADIGANYVSTSGNNSILDSSVEIKSATADALQGLTTNIVGIDATNANAADLSIGGFQSTAPVNLASTGVKNVTLSDGVDSFDLSFLVNDAFSNTDSGDLEVQAIGAMVFADAADAEPAFNFSSRVIVETDNLVQRNTFASASANRLEIADGFETFTFARSVDDGTFLVEYDPVSGLMQLTNLTNGLVQSQFIDPTVPIAASETQDVAFNALGAVITLNDDFDKSVAIDSSAAQYSATVAGGAVIEGSVELLAATAEEPPALGTGLLNFDATSANQAILTIGDFAAAAPVDLTSPGVKFVTLTDGDDTFDISFHVDTAFSDTDAGNLQLQDLGALVFNQHVGPLEISGSRNADTLNGDVLDDVIFGDDGDDVMTGGSGSDLMHGGGGADRIDGGDDDDLLIGFWGDDAITGGAGRDRIFGNSGDDILAGGTGNDRLTGQFGADTFVHAPGDNNDGVTDFDPTEDLIDLTAHNFANFAAVQALMSQIASGTLIDLAGPDSVLLEGVAIGAVGEANFML